jgi:hypothetical protein
LRSGWVKPKTIKLICVASPVRHQGVRTKTGRLGITITCLSGATCLTDDCCYSELEVYKSYIFISYFAIIHLSIVIDVVFSLFVVYGYGIAANAICCVCSLGGAVILPCAKRFSSAYHVFLSVFLGLAVGTLFTGAIVHLSSS